MSKSMETLLLTHDLSCTLGELNRAAARSRRVLEPPLLRGAIAFTIQLAIDCAGRDPAEMRALERALLEAIPDE